MSFEDALLDDQMKNVATDIYFSNQKLRRMDPLMDPKNTIRECRDSENHPKVIPIIMGLDVTGSMTDLPKKIVAQELDKFMSKALELKLDPAVLFTAIGDLYKDSAPFQIGQFESGDDELDLWLSKTWIEGNGGGNGGESYNLLWLYAINCIFTDYEEKHNSKPFLFTFGDEECLPGISRKLAEQLYGSDSKAMALFGEKDQLDNIDLLTALKKRFNVYHFHINHDYSVIRLWQGLLGENFHILKNESEIVPKILEIITQVINLDKNVLNSETVIKVKESSNFDWLDKL
jgi:hypothetical protein